MHRIMRIVSALLLFIGVGGLIAGAVGSALSLEWLRTVGTAVILFGTGFGSLTALFVDRTLPTEPAGTHVHLARSPKTGRL